LRKTQGHIFRWDFFIKVLPSHLIFDGDFFIKVLPSHLIFDYIVAQIFGFVKVLRYNFSIFAEDIFYYIPPHFHYTLYLWINQ